MQKIQIGDFVQWKGSGSSNFKVIGFTKNIRGSKLIIIKEMNCSEYRPELNVHPSYLSVDIKTTRKLKLKKIYNEIFL